MLKSRTLYRNPARVGFAVVLALLTGGVHEADGQKDPTVGGAAMFPTKTIVDNAVNSPVHRTLVAAVRASGLVDILSSPGPFTVFAPTDKAFDKLPPGTVDTLVKPENRDTLANLLSYHVIDGRVTSKDIISDIKRGGGRAILKTVEGEPLSFSMSGRSIVITDTKGGTSDITTEDVFQSNGIVHVINAVLMPSGRGGPAWTTGGTTISKDGHGPPLRRVSGTGLLMPRIDEEAGYGLYSYALLAHMPNDDEKPVYRAFFEALVAMPTARNLRSSLPINRVNITEIPVTSNEPKWDSLSLKKRADFVLKNYDYAHAAAILGSLREKTGSGPVIISLLTPINVQTPPIPVLVEDLTLAKPGMMRQNVDYFIQQAGKDEFWDEATLDKFFLSLRNFLEVSADAARMSREAVKEWLQISRSK